jgi:hypothetical protein
MISVVFSKLARFSSFSSVSAQCFFSRFLVQKRPSRPDFIYKFMDACSAWNCDPGKFMTKLSLTLSSRTTFHIQFIQKNMMFNSISNHIHTHNN